MRGSSRPVPLLPCSRPTIPKPPATLQILSRALICETIAHISKLSRRLSHAFANQVFDPLSCKAHVSHLNPLKHTPPHTQSKKKNNKTKTILDPDPPLSAPTWPLLKNLLCHPLIHPTPRSLQARPLVKTFAKSYFPLIKYSSVLQMYAWITCHTLSLLRTAPR